MNLNKGILSELKHSFSIILYDKTLKLKNLTLKEKYFRK